MWLSIWVVVRPVAIMGDRLGNWDMDCQGIDFGFGWLTGGLTGRVQRSLGKGSVGSLWPPLPITFPVWSCLSHELMTFCWGRVSGVCIEDVEMLQVCRQSSRMCWQVLSFCLYLFQLAGRLLVGRSTSPLSDTEGHHIRLACVLLSAGALSMHI